MSQFISLRILASLGLGRSKKASNRETPGAPAVSEQPGDAGVPRDEPSSRSRIRVDRARVNG